MKKLMFIFILALISQVLFACTLCSSCGAFTGAALQNCLSSCATSCGGGSGTSGIGTPDIGQITSALQDLCKTVKNILGVGMMLMVVSAAAVYSVGQVMGAETRARASVWATSMFNGAIIAALIYLIVPFVLNKMLTSTSVIVECFVFF